MDLNRLNYINDWLVDWVSFVQVYDQFSFAGNIIKKNSARIIVLKEGNILRMVERDGLWDAFRIVIAAMDQLHLFVIFDAIKLHKGISKFEENVSVSKNTLDGIVVILEIVGY